MKTITPSKPFSNGTEYEIFLENFCFRCKHGKINEDGYAEYPENGGCKTWDAMENARFDIDLFPCDDVVMIKEEGKMPLWNVCKHFESIDDDLMKAYQKLFESEVQGE